MLGKQDFYTARPALLQGTFETWSKPRLDPQKEAQAETVHTAVVAALYLALNAAFLRSTPAAEMDDHLDDDTKEARRDELVSIFQDRAEEWAQAQVGKRMEVVIDTMEGLDAIGRSYADAPDIDGSVRLPQCVLAPGTVVTVEVVAADVMELVAQPAAECAEMLRALFFVKQKTAYEIP